MSLTLSDVLATLEPIASGVVAAHAVDVDASGRFPSEGVAALQTAGLFGLISAPSVGGLGLGHRAAAAVVGRLARECASTAMVTCMHYAATAVLEAHGREDVRRDIAAGRHLTTLAFSEAGSRSHFWAPVSTATAVAGGVRLDAKKSWVTSASHADSYVWSSRPVSAEGASTIWHVARQTPGLAVSGGFDGLGLRGNDSAPVAAEGALVTEQARLGADGAGFDVMMGVVLPYFQLMSGAVSLGLMESAVARVCAHAGATRFDHLGSSLAELPTLRAYVARMRIDTDKVAALLESSLAALESGAPETMLRVLEIKAAAGESATQVLDLAMRVSGGAAFRKDVGVERFFRDARAATVMAPTTDVLYDFIGKAALGLPLFG